MKIITKEQIDTTISKVAREMSDELCNIFSDNINKCEKELSGIGKENMKEYSLYFATMGTALQISIDIMKKVFTSYCVMSELYFQE